MLARSSINNKTRSRHDLYVCCQIFILWFGVLATLVFSPLAFAETVKYVCKVKNSDYEVRIVGGKGDLIEVHNLKLGKFYPNYSETRAEMGGKSGALRCDDVYSTPHMIAVRTGWKNDLLQIYGLPSNPTDNALSKIRYLARDYEMSVHPADQMHFKGTYTGIGEAIRTNQGKKSDVRNSICWAHSIGKFFSASGGWRSGSFPPCNADMPDHLSTTVSFTNQSLAQNQGTAQKKPSPRKQTPQRKFSFYSGVRGRCKTRAGNSGGVDLIEGSDNSCQHALSKARKAAQGACKKIGSNYSFWRNEFIKTTTCPNGFK